MNRIVEARGSLPPGYSWQEVPEMRATFPKPDAWFYKYAEVLNTQACFVTRERILADRPAVTLKEMIEMVKKGRGFETGLSVNTFSGISEGLDVSPAVFAKNVLTTNFLLVPESDLKTEQDGDLTTFKGYFRSGSRLLASRGMPPLKYYIQTAGNAATDRAYILMFEVPAKLWEENKETAQVVIDNARLDPTF